ncbi:PBP1A family penicillin-binding protein [Candidatus Binatia bacterium]|nr:PBP1A family penicillin-binding protein [Candidatus Binatia bacterium]
MIRRFLLAAALAAGGLLAIGGIGFWTFARDWDARVTELFRTHRWDFPSKIYSDATLVYPGLDIEAGGVLTRLQAVGYHPVTGPIERPGDYHLPAQRTHLDIYLRRQPGDAAAAAGPMPVRLTLAGNTVVHMRDLHSDRDLFTLEVEPALVSGLFRDVWEERHVVTLDAVPPLLLRAIVAVEDQRFFSHPGVDPIGIARALVVNLRSGSTVQGGSTLTQQLIKNFFLSEERTLQRKAREAAMALIVERRFSKQQILEGYINEIYLGQNGSRGIYGVWEASRVYFAKEPRDLSLAEVALLAGLIRAPNRYSPLNNPERARARRDAVLETMLVAGDITPADSAAARAEPIRTVPSPQRTDGAPYFVDFVRRELSALYPADILNREGLEVFTRLDLHLQRIAEESVRAGLADLERRHPRLRAAEPRDRLQACLIALEPQTGAVKAMVGGRDYGTTQFNRCTQALRQPGSVFKPIVYVAALDNARQHDIPLLPTTRIEDEPFAWPFDHQVWTPANYGNQYRGTVTVRTALTLSLNAATARLAHDVGLEAIVETARRFGIASPLQPYPSLVLGAAEVSPLEIAQAYTALAAGGLRATPLSVARVTDRDGIAIERVPVEVERVTSAETAFLVEHLLRGVVDTGTGAGVRRRGFTRPAAGKTGTTNDYSDAWFVGFTPELLAVVWVGFDQRRPLNLAGADAALPIWTDFMQRALAGRPVQPFLPPPGIAIVRIDPVSGLAATTACPEVIDEAFYRGQEPSDPCPLHPVHGDA